jgi:hypothetical protein
MEGNITFVCAAISGMMVWQSHTLLGNSGQLGQSERGFRVASILTFGKLRNIKSFLVSSLQISVCPQNPQLVLLTFS